MQTGYDNYWIHQSNRPKQLLNLGQTNNCHSFPDSDRQGQWGRPPTFFSNHIQHENSATYYYQNRQYYETGIQETWPPPGYSVPLKPSYENNIQTRGAFTTWFDNTLNNTNYPPKNLYANQISNGIYSENHNFVSQMQTSKKKSNSNVNVTPATANNSKSTEIQTPRIRVKDVFSLNNSTIDNQLFPEGILNYALNNSSKAIPPNSYYKTQLPSYFESTALRQSQQCNNSFYKKNESQTLFGVPNSSLHVYKTNPPVLPPQKIPPSKVIKKPKIKKPQKKLSDSSNGSEKVNIQPTVSVTEKTLENINSLSSIQTLNQVTSNANRVPQLPQLPIQSYQQSGSKNSTAVNFNSPNTCISNLCTEVTSNPEDLSHKQVQSGTLVKISVPHTGQSNFIRIDDINCTNSNSILSAPYVFESNNQFVNKDGQDSASLTKNQNEAISLPVLLATPNESNTSSTESLKNSESEPLKNFSSFRRRVVTPKEPFLSVNKENLEKFISNSDTIQNDSNSNLCTLDANLSKETNNENETVLNFSLKQDNFIASAGNLSNNHSISNSNKLTKIIKSEKTLNKESPKDPSAQFSENPQESVLQESLPPAVEDTENINSTEVNTEEVSSNKPESNAVKNSENNVQKGQSLREKSHICKKKYKSKINRVKLDMLIQFLKKDEESDQTPLSEKTLTNTENSIDRKSNRRKLSKTNIVKNKNNSREMVSLMSPKTARMGTSQIVKSNTDSEKVKKGEDFIETGKNNENEDSSPFSKDQHENDSSQSEQNNSNESVEKVQEPNDKSEEDKTLISILQELKNKSTNLCTSCNLSSSIESFWINVVSSELRCLNCFKKSLSTEISKNYHNTEKPGLNIHENEKTEKQINTNDENRLKDVDKSEDFPHFIDSRNSIISKEILQEETATKSVEETIASKTKLPDNTLLSQNESFGKMNEKELLREIKATERIENPKENLENAESKRKILPKKNSTSKPVNYSKQLPDSSEKFEINSTPEENYCSLKKSISKGEHLVKKQAENVSQRRSKSKEKENVENILKKEKKKTDVTPRKSSTEFYSQKTLFSDVPTEKKRKTSTDTQNKKTTKNCHKERITEIKISKHEQTKTSDISKKCLTYRKLKTSEQYKSNDSTNDLEKHIQRKRKPSNDDSPLRKVCVLEVHTKKEIVHVTYSSQKSDISSSKDVSASHKHKTDNDKQISKSSTVKSKPKDVQNPKEQTRDEIKQYKNIKNTDEKAKNRFMGNTSKSLDKNNDERLTLKQQQKPDLESNPLKENQNKIRNSTDKLKNRSYHVREKSNKQEKKTHKEMEGREGMKEHSDRDANTKAKKLTEKPQRENKQLKGLEKPLEHPTIESKKVLTSKDIHGSPNGKESATLLEKLIKRTKQLSWSLLGET